MKKRIAFISDHASPLATLGGVDSGGQNVYVAELAKELACMGFNVDVYTRRDSHLQQPVVTWKPGIRIIHITAGPARDIEKEQLLPFMDEFAQNMIAFIQQQRLNYDMVHANFFMSGMVASTIKRILKIPFVITFHALGMVRKLHQKEMDKFPAERNNIEWSLVRDADAVIAECPQDKADLIQHYGADPAKIAVISCGFSADEFYPVNKQKARKMLHLDPNEIVLLQLGRMVPRKGVDNVIQSLKHLQSNKKIRLLIVGGSSDIPDMKSCPELKRLHELAVSAGVQECVHFAGRKSRQQLKFYYSAADIFITTPWYEPFGITPLEAMACATPVIGADVGGIKYSVSHGETGLLVSPNDPRALAGSIDKLLQNDALRNTMGKKSLERVNTLFTWKKIAHDLINLYKQYMPVPYSYTSMPVPLPKYSGMKAIGQFLQEPVYSKLNVQS